MVYIILMKFQAKKILWIAKNKCRMCRWIFLVISRNLYVSHTISFKLSQYDKMPKMHIRPYCTDMATIWQKGNTLNPHLMQCHISCNFISKYLLQIIEIISMWLSVDLEIECLNWPWITPVLQIISIHPRIYCPVRSIYTTSSW